MRLLDLDPSFRRILDERTHETVDDIAQADGVMFLCPKCFVTNGGEIGAHSGSPKVPQTWPPTPSILLLGGCAAHFFIRNGQIEMA